MRETVLHLLYQISIHALRGEGDKNGLGWIAEPFEFQSTPSVGRATFKIGREIGKYIGISIHALRGEGDCKKLMTKPKKRISIHALRGEGDKHNRRIYLRKDISIHALRGEGDPSGVRFAVNCKDFNPRPPWGGRRYDV